MKIEVSPARFQVRFYDNNGKYSGSMNVEKHGPRGIIDSLWNQRGFYQNFDAVWDHVNLICGISIWQAHMEADHLELAIKVLCDRGRYKLDVLADEENADRKMLWIELSKPD